MSTDALLRRIAKAEARSHAQMATGGNLASFGPLVALSLGREPNGEPLPVDTGWHDGSLPPTEADLKAFEHFSEQHGQPATLHLLSHAAPPLLPLLSARGYELRYVLHVYSHDLKVLPPEPAADVRQTNDAQAWAQLAAQGFGPGSETIMQVVGQVPGKRLFVAYTSGQAVASAAYSLEDGLAAFHGTATPPEFREQGWQTALLQHRLRAAHAEGADLATVFVTPGSGSERNVGWVGFKLTGLRLTFTRR